MRETRSGLYCDDVLVVIFVAARQLSGHAQFRVHNHKLQEIFHKLQGKFSLLACFVFSNNGPSPFSPLLEEAIENLQFAGLLNRSNLGDWEVINVRPSAEAYFREQLQGRLFPEEQQQFEEIARAFLGQIPVASAYT